MEWIKTENVFSVQSSAWEQPSWCSLLSGPSEKEAVSLLPDKGKEISLATGWEIPSAPARVPRHSPCSGQQLAIFPLCLVQAMCKQQVSLCLSAQCLCREGDLNDPYVDRIESRPWLGYGPYYLPAFDCGCSRHWEAKTARTPGHGSTAGTSLPAHSSLQLFHIHWSYPIRVWPHVKIIWVWHTLGPLGNQEKLIKFLLKYLWLYVKGFISSPRVSRTSRKRSLQTPHLDFL